jgi:predicted MPP superfamily phosphohydrolase
MKKEKSTKNKFLRYFLFILLLGLMVVFYSYFIGTKGLKVREYGVINNKIPESFDGFKVVQFSDLHYGTTIKDEEVDKIVSEINNLKPDLVVFTGDLIDVHYDISDEEIESLSNALNNIEATIGKYIVRGNHDVNPGFEKVLQNIDFIDLDNQNTFIYYNDNAPIVLVGLDDYL